MLRPILTDRLLGPARTVYITAPPASSMDAATRAYVAAMTTTPDAARVVLYDQFIRAVKAAGVWTKLDLLYLLAAHADQPSRVNLIAPSTYLLTKSGTPPVFTADRGWVSNNVGDLDTGFNPATAGGKFALDDASLGAASLTDVADVAGAFLVGNANARLGPRSSTGTFNTRANDATTNGGANTGVGLYGVSRSAAGSYKKYRRGAVFATASVTSTAVTSASLRILSSNGSTFSNANASLAFAGRALSDAEQAALWSAYAAYMTAIGVTP